MIDKIVEALEAAPPATQPGCNYLGRISYRLTAVVIVITDLIR